MKDAATELSALAERVEQAEPHMQGVLLDRAWDELAECSAVFQRYAVAHQPGFDNNAGKFAMAMEARAYESAAMMLVPEGWGWTLTGEGTACAYSTEATTANVTMPSGKVVQFPGVAASANAKATTPALALAAACLRAHAATATGEG